MQSKEPVKYRLRQMGKKDIGEGMRLKKAAKWNQLEQDWNLFLEAGQDGSLVAEYLGQVVGTVTTVNYLKRFSWIGMLLVDPSIRRMGIGTRLLKEAIRLSLDNGTIRLDATPKGKKLYDTMGFKDEYNLSRYQLIQYDPERIPDPHLPCQKISRTDIALITDFDEKIFGAPRPVILQSLYRMGSSYAWIRKSENRIIGYCLGRPGSNFEQIGPVIAEDFESAASLLSHAMQQCQGKSVIVDIPDDQMVFRSYVEEIGFSIQRPFIRMHLGELHYPGQPQFQYAIAGPEIG